MDIGWTARARDNRNQVFQVSHILPCTKYPKSDRFRQQRVQKEKTIASKNMQCNINQLAGHSVDLKLWVLAEMHVRATIATKFQINQIRTVQQLP